MPLLSFDNPVFAAYAIAAAICVLMVNTQSWITIYRLLKIGGGFASPEDARAGMFNRHPRAGQLDNDDYVDRSRRMHRNHLENFVGFWVAGALFVLTAPDITLAQILFAGFVVTRLLHFAAYMTGQSHELRGTLFTPGSLITLFMAVYVLWHLVSSA